MKRRRFLAAVAAALHTPLLAQRFQPAQDITPLLTAILKGAVPERRGVTVDLPQIAENGNSVPLRIRIDNPMTPEDHVKTVHVFAERNPRPRVAVFHLGPDAGRADISARVRLAGTQKVTVLAELSGDRFLIATPEVLVTSAACLDESL
jgi:sulfur-oxidizing protein SoxY